MRKLGMVLAALAMAGTTLPVHAVEAIGRSNPLRQVLLDTMRGDIEAELGVEVQFVVDTLQVEGEWAFMAGSVQQADGSPIDFSQTPYGEAEAEGMFDGPTVRALMSRQGKGWMVEAYSIGATDVVEAGWPDTFGVPCSVVGFC